MQTIDFDKIGQNLKKSQTLTSVALKSRSSLTMFLSTLRIGITLGEKTAEQSYMQTRLWKRFFSDISKSVYNVSQ